MDRHVPVFVQAGQLIHVLVTASVTQQTGLVFVIKTLCEAIGLGRDANSAS